MPLVLYNTLSRQKQVFEPISPPSEAGLPQVKFYVCGVTVYDRCHLGHARTYIVWDTVRRYLQWRGYQVTYVQNFTDIDDKILKRAAELGESVTTVTERNITAYFEDMDRLNILRADHYPRATQSLPAIISLIESLELNHFAYRVKRLRSLAQGSQAVADPAESGHQDPVGRANRCNSIDPSESSNSTESSDLTDQDVYYAVRQFADYGQLSGRKLEDLQAGASGRVGEEEERKRDPFDFALWKSADRHEVGFDSPWGWGRPGWHIECSAMVRETLGDHIDIHAGGADLIFPHHENEIAQSEPITGQPMAKYWLHNGFLNINGEKMSKSLGNFTTLQEALKVYDPMALRLFFLQTQYRSPIDLTDESLSAATQGWSTLHKGIQAARSFGVSGEATGSSSPQASPSIPPDTEAMAAFQTAMDDDFGTPGAIAVVFDLAKDLIRERNVLVHEGKTHLDETILQSKRQTYLTLMDVLGLLPANLLTEDTTAESSVSGITDGEIEALIEQRRAAKKERNYQAADQIRDTLKQQGITLIDQPGGITRWIRQ